MHCRLDKVHTREAYTVHHLNSDADRALFGPFEKAMLPLWLSMKSALDLVATLEPGDAVLAGTLAVLQHVQAQDNRQQRACRFHSGHWTVCCTLLDMLCALPFKLCVLRVGTDKKLQREM